METARPFVRPRRGFRGALASPSARTRRPGRSRGRRTRRTQPVTVRSGLRGLTRGRGAGRRARPARVRTWGRGRAHRNRLRACRNRSSEPHALDALGSCVAPQASHQKATPRPSVEHSLEDLLAPVRVSRRVIFLSRPCSLDVFTFECYDTTARRDTCRARLLTLHITGGARVLSLSFTTRTSSRPPACPRRNETET